MNIGWQYLDKRDATIKALRDWPAMEHILRESLKQEAAARQDMLSPSSTTLDAMPRAHDPKAGESRLIHLMDEMDVLKQRYRQAREFKDWFMPAWDRLSDKDQFILRQYYRDYADDATTATENVCRQLNYERSSAYKSKTRAVEMLALYLYGR